MVNVVAKRDGRLGIVQPDLVAEAHAVAQLAADRP